MCLLHSWNLDCICILYKLSKDRKWLQKYYTKRKWLHSKPLNCLNVPNTQSAMYPIHILQPRLGFTFNWLWEQTFFKKGHVTFTVMILNFQPDISRFVITLVYKHIFKIHRICIFMWLGYTKHAWILVHYKGTFSIGPRFYCDSWGTAGMNL